MVHSSKIRLNCMEFLDKGTVQRRVGCSASYRTSASCWVDGAYKLATGGLVSPLAVDIVGGARDIGKVMITICMLSVELFAEEVVHLLIRCVRIVLL